MQPEAVQDIASDIIRQAGVMLLQRFGRPHQEASKSSVYDIVTEDDRDVEAFLVAALAAAFPQHHVVGEEGGDAGAPASADWHWYIDPIDGTSNYASDLPFFSISMALCDPELRPLLGLVLNPVARELYSARRGGGTTLNGEPLQVSARDSLQNAILSCGYSRHPVHGRRVTPRFCVSCHGHGDCDFWAPRRWSWPGSPAAGLTAISSAD